MIDLDISFEEQPWEQYLGTLSTGRWVSAGHLLTLLEGESEQTVEDALDTLAERGLLLEVEDLPRTFGSGDTGIRLRREKELAQQPLNPQTLEPGDPLRLYLEELAALPAWGDENLLAESVLEGEEAAREPLVNLGLSRVVDLSREYVGFGVLLLDLIQEGSMGLLQGLDQTWNGDYSAFRDECIRRAMARAVFLQARANGVGQKIRAAMEDFRQVDERLLGELGRNPTLEEIAEQLHMRPEEASAVQKMLSDARLLAQIKPDPAEQEEAEDDQAVEDTALFHSRARVLDLLSGLTEIESSVLSARFGLEGGKPLSVQETASSLGLSQAQVSALERCALEKLREKK